MKALDREFSLLANDPPSRELGVALAHCMGVCKPGRHVARLELLNKVYRDSGLWVQLQCRGELKAMRIAKSGQVEAKVAFT